MKKRNKDAILCQMLKVQDLPLDNCEKYLDVKFSILLILMDSMKLD